MSAYSAVVLEHFRRPHNRGRLERADVSAEGANPLCGDRLRLDLRLEAGRVADASFTADACVLCVAAASLLTDHVRGMPTGDAAALADDVVFAWIGRPPAARVSCVTLPLDTLRRALGNGAASV